MVSGQLSVDELCALGTFGQVGSSSHFFMSELGGFEPHTSPL